MHQVAQSNPATPTKGRGHAVLPSGQMLPFLLTTAIFFIWGMSNNLTDVLVQQFKKSFELSLLQAQLVQTAVFLAYGVMAIPAALLMRRYGYKAALVTGLVVFATGTLLFWPAALIGRYAPFLFALFVVGTGSSVLETAANPLIAQFGDPATSEERLNFAQAWNPPGTIAGVILGVLFIFSGVEKSPADVSAMQAAGTYSSYLHEEIVRVVPTYVGLGLVVLLLALFISRTSFPSGLDQPSFSESPAPGNDVSLLGASGFAGLISHPHLMFAVVAQFFYVGAQVATWSTFIPYIKAYTKITDRGAGYFLTGTLLALAFGRIVSTPLMRYISPATMMVVYAVANFSLLLVGILHPGFVGASAILATSFFMSIMYPTIFALGVKGLGADTKLGSSLLVMAILGGAVFPPLMGAITRFTGSVAMGYALPAIAYLVVAIYGFLAPRLGREDVVMHSFDVPL